MSRLVRRKLPAIKRLRRLSACQRKKFFRTCSDDFLNALSECAKNVLRGNVPLTASQFKKLRPYKQVLRVLSSRRSSVGTRRKLLQQKGGFIGAILGPLLGLATSLFGGLLNRRSDQ